MKKLLVCLFAVLFCVYGTAWAKNKGEDKGKHKERVRVEKTEQTAYEHSAADDDDIDDKGEKIKEKENAGKKSEPPEGVQKAAEKGKGKKKGLFERWFGGSKE